MLEYELKNETTGVVVARFAMYAHAIYLKDALNSERLQYRQTNKICVYVVRKVR